MQNNSQKLNEIFFDVELMNSKVLAPGLSFSHGLTSMVYATDTQKVLNVCSDDYKLISNRELFLPVYEKLADKFGADMVDVKVKNIDDRKFYVDMVINNRPYGVTTGDIVNPMVQMTNSYDGTLKFSLGVSFYRQVCSNGMMGWVKEAAQTKKHSTDNFGFESLFSVIDKTNSQLERFKALSERRITPKEMEELTELIKDKTQFPKNLIKEVPEVIEREKQILGTDTNSWLAYHGFNNRLNHSDIKMHPEFKAKIDLQVLQLVEAF